jgi:hypothetical protein
MEVVNSNFEKFCDDFSIYLPQVIKNTYPYEYTFTIIHISN